MNNIVKSQIKANKEAIADLNKKAKTAQGEEKKKLEAKINSKIISNQVATNGKRS